MRPVKHRAVLAALVPVLALTLAGCGGSDAPAPATSSAPGATTPASPEETPATGQVPDDLCAVVTAAEVSTALGVTVTLKTGPSGDCEFSEEDPRGISGSFGVIDYADLGGGYPGYVSGLDASLKAAKATVLTGVGTAAVVKVGLPVAGGSENLLAAGVVDRETFLLQVTLAQAKNLPVATLTKVTGDLLRLLDQKTP